MEDKQIFKIGDRVEQMCVTCGEERGHLVASMTKTGKIHASQLSEMWITRSL
jgi:hypothetical protein